MNVEIIPGIEGNDPFHTVYEMESNLLSKNGEKTILGDRQTRICRFCGNKSDETSFKSKAHILPEFMGNKFFFSNYECDSCNSLFSTYETSLSHYGGILNTFSLVKGKKGYPKHKGTIENTISVVEDGKVVQYINNPNDNENERSAILDKERGTLTFRSNKYSYIPIEAYKALIKIGICMLDSKYLDDYKNTIAWLLDKSELNLDSNNPLYCIYQKIGGRLFKNPWAVLMRKRKFCLDQPYPTHSLLVFYGLFAFQFFLPGNINDGWIWKTDRILLPIENHITLSKQDGGKLFLGVDRVDLSSKELLKNPEHNFTVKYTESK